MKPTSRNIEFNRQLKNASTSNKTWRVSFVLLEHFSMMAFTGAVDALVTANLLSESTCFQFTFYGEKGDIAKSDLNIDVATISSYVSINAETTDVILVCGGLRTSLETRPKLRITLQKISRLNVLIGGVWNGSYILAQAGVLEGYECTIHPENNALMSEVFPTVNVSKKPYVIDRDRFSSAGATSTLSLMLHLIQQLVSDDLMCRVEGILNVDSVLGEDSDGSLTMMPINPQFPEVLKIILSVMEEYIDEPRSMAQIADDVNVSRRRVERLFEQYLGTSPARYYLQLRLNRGYQLLRQSNASVANVALACGFNSVVHFSQRFKVEFGVSPSVVRRGAKLST